MESPRTKASYSATLLKASKPNFIVKNIRPILSIALEIFTPTPAHNLFMAPSKYKFHSKLGGSRYQGKEMELASW